ncbi:MAG: hypothetical protein ACJ760_15420 [Thermoleophilaceae bacterium]
MSVRLVVVADPPAATLASLDGVFDWGEAVTAAPGAVPDADVLLSLAEEGIVAGAELWSRAAWPVRDDLFAEHAPGAGVLVVGDAERDGGLLAKLAAQEIPHRAVPVASAEDVLAAAVVAFPPAPGHDGRYVPGSLRDAVPAAAFAPLAARRGLILPRAQVTFGLLPGSDHLAASTDDEVVQYAAALLAHPDAFRIQVALGAIAAERQRASVVYGRLVADLAASAG